MDLRNVSVTCACPANGRTKGDQAGLIVHPVQETATLHEDKTCILLCSLDERCVNVVSSLICFLRTQFTGYKAQRPHYQEESA